LGYTAPRTRHEEGVGSVKNDRLANSVLYLLRGCPDAGLTKLLKLLYHADYLHYREHLSTITGATYVALERGPVVDGYKEEFEALEGRGILSTREKRVLGHDKLKKEYLPLVEPNLTAFDEDELATLDEVLLRYGNMSGLALSRMTHEEALPWSFVWDEKQPGGAIPPALFRWLDNMADERDLEISKSRVAAMTRDAGAH